MAKDVYIKNDDKFYSIIKKYKNKNDYIIHYLCNDNDIIDDSILKKKKKFTKELEEKIICINAVNIKDIRKRYTYIYDYMCEYLDNELKQTNYCDFKCNKCANVRHKNLDSVYGCCYGKRRGLCKFLDKDHCTTNNIACKLFTCRYLRKLGYKYSTKDFNILKIFFNRKQREIIELSFFKSKEEILDLLIN